MLLLRSIGGRGWSLVSGRDGLASEIPLCIDVDTNLNGKNAEGPYLVGSLFGANPS